MGDIVLKLVHFHSPHLLGMEGLAFPFYPAKFSAFLCFLSPQNSENSDFENFFKFFFQKVRYITTLISIIQFWKFLFQEL